jgi:hypothetical protein
MAKQNPKKAKRGSGAAQRDTLALYVRVLNADASEARAIAKELGYPNTIASVCGKLIGEALAARRAKANMPHVSDLEGVQSW